jgi:hypothetical protein
VTRHLEAWRLSGSCASHPLPDLWFDDDPAGVAHAKQVCGGCPVRATCLADALARGEEFGVLGGLTGAERRRVGMGPVHGKRGTYTAGCRCPDCEHANTRYVAEWRRRRSWHVTAGGVLAVVHVLESPAGAGRRRAFPGQLYLDLEAIA